MKYAKMLAHTASSLLLVLMAVTSWAQNAAVPSVAPTEGSWLVKDFRFHTGEVLPELRLHYTTLGSPSNEAVLVLHGTTGSGAGLLGPAFGGELFGPGQPLDAGKYFIILPDVIGHGKSSKPSDGLRTKFPRYNYDSTFNNSAPTAQLCAHSLGSIY